MKSLPKLLTLLLCLGTTAYAQEPLRLAATIPPLEFIAAAIVGEYGEVSAVMDAQDSPHHFNLSPGDRLTLATADLILWVGPELETQLQDFLARPAQADRALQVTGLSGVTIRNLASGETDPHVWLAPDNARLIAAALTARMVELDAGRAGQYRDNLARFENDLDARIAAIRQQLQGLQDVDFLVYHDAFGYYEQAFGLSHSLALVNNPEVQPGMRELLARQAQIRELGARCLVLEPEASAALVARLTDDSADMHTVNVDLLGFDMPAGRDAYTQWLAAVTEQIAACLTAAAGKQQN